MIINGLVGMLHLSLSLVSDQRRLQIRASSLGLDKATSYNAAKCLSVITPYFHFVVPNNNYFQGTVIIWNKLQVSV